MNKIYIPGWPFILLLIFRERKRKEMEEEYEKEIMEKEARKR